MNGFVSGKVGKLELGHLKRKHNRVFPSKVKENKAPEPLSLVQNRVRLPKKNLQKSTLALKEGPGEGGRVKLRRNAPLFVRNRVLSYFDPVFPLS
jgi:hypothetical protein